MRPKQKGSYIMKKLISLLVALVLVVTCLAGISFAADPLFEVTNGSEVKTVDTVADMLALINENGKTKVKLLRSYHHDVSDTGMGIPADPEGLLQNFFVHDRRLIREVQVGKNGDFHKKYPIK